MLPSIKATPANSQFLSGNVHSELSFPLILCIDIWNQPGNGPRPARLASVIVFPANKLTAIGLLVRRLLEKIGRKAGRQAGRQFV